MRLIELKPRWLAGRFHDGDHERKLGVSFLCPHCRSQRLGVYFANPMDGGSQAKGIQYLWQRDGDDFETMSLSPSIDTTRPSETGLPAEFKGHWHGFVRNGNVE